MMTLFHFCNCIAIAFVPYVIVYKYSGLSEYSPHWKCAQASSAYLLTQLVKMLLLATFFPVSGDGRESFSVIYEFFKTSIDLIDLLGIYLLLNRFLTKGQLKYLIVGMGWAIAELMVSRVVPMWVGARGVEFNWSHVQSALDSNMNLVHHTVIAMLVWLYSRGELVLERQRTVIVGLLIGLIYEQLLLQLVGYSFNLNNWLKIVVRFSYVCLVSLASLQSYFIVTGSKGILQNGSSTY